MENEIFYGKRAGHENDDMFVQGDMEVSRHCERMRSTPANYLACCAFTLAEVLITLGIIGVVAALTLPNLVAKYQKKAVVTQLKKSYTVMQQALKLSQIDNGDIDNWDTNLDGHNFFIKYISPYVKTIKEYSTSELKSAAPRKLLNGGTYSGTTYNNETASHFILADGSMVTVNLHNAAEKGLWVGFDVNGLTKPNQIGKDTFLFYFSSKYGLVALGDRVPAGWTYNTNTDDLRKELLTGGGNSCSLSGLGYWCSALIVTDGWEIRDDYPW